MLIHPYRPRRPPSAHTYNHAHRDTNTHTTHLPEEWFHGTLKINENTKLEESSEWMTGIPFILLFKTTMTVKSSKVSISDEANAQCGLVAK